MPALASLPGLIVPEIILAASMFDVVSVLYASGFELLELNASITLTLFLIRFSAAEPVLLILTGVCVKPLILLSASALTECNVNVFMPTLPTNSL